MFLSHSFDTAFMASVLSLVCASLTGSPYTRTRRNFVPFLTHKLEKFWRPMKIASSPIPDTGVLIVFGEADDLAPANIFSLCIETVTVTLGAPVVVQLQPVFAIGELAPTLASTTVLTWFCVSRLHGRDSLLATSGQQSKTTNTLEKINADDFRALIVLSYREAYFPLFRNGFFFASKCYRATARSVPTSGAPHGNKIVGICIITPKRLSRTLVLVSRLVGSYPISALHAGDPHWGGMIAERKPLVGSQFVLACDLEFSCAASLTFVSWNGVGERIPLTRTRIQAAHGTVPLKCAGNTLPARPGILYGPALGVQRCRPLPTSATRAPEATPN
ncbi:MAG: hypothetical protein JWO19_5559 [Bryobacterales bacterium]|nr:hypothetical protein [Bryobacterales bacterium]